MFICAAGAGSFGSWNDGDLPSFRWQLNQFDASAPTWRDSRGTMRRDHWHVTGNDRLNMLMSDSGTVSLFATDRGERWLNELDVDRLQLGGAFSYVTDLAGGRVESSAFGWMPASARASAEREFGVAFLRTRSLLLGGSLAVTHRAFAPFGNDSFVIDDVLVENVGASPLAVQLTEFFDVNQLQLVLDWVMTGVGGTAAYDARRLVNSLFVETAGPLAGDPTIMVAQMRPVLGARASAYVDWKPPTVFAALADGWNQSRVVANHADQRVFFGNGTAAQPAALMGATVSSSNLTGDSAFEQNAMLGFSLAPVRLAPGQSQRLSFLFGWTNGDDVAATVLRVRTAGATAIWRDTVARWNATVVHFAINSADADVLAREAAWRQANFLSWATWRGDWQRSALTQGSAYLYLHGADGVPRDQSLFSLAALFSRPDVVRSTLELLLETQDSTGAMTYAWGDFRLRSDALGLHAWPCDLDVFLMMAVSEYVSFTGDVAWMAAQLPRLRVAAHHLMAAVGKGPHGLLRIGDGDWDDGVVVGLGNPISIALTIANGESVPTTAMCVVVVARFAKIVAQLDGALAAQLAAWAAPFASALRDTSFFNGTYARMWAFDSFGRPLLVANGTLDLQAIVWPLLAPDGVLLSRREKIALIDATLQQLSSPIGPLMSASNRQVWPAISQLFVAGVAGVPERAHLALPLLRQHTYETHAQTFNTSWIGVLGGPDGFTLDGGTWASPVTPMTDWPTANSNGDAMFVFGLVRVLGISGTDDGFAIDATRLAASALPFRFASPLLTIAVNATAVDVTYVSQCRGGVVVSVTPFGATTPVKVKLRFAAAGEVHEFTV